MHTLFWSCASPMRQQREACPLNAALFNCAFICLSDRLLTKWHP